MSKVKRNMRLYVEFWQYTNGDQAIAIKRLNTYNYYPTNLNLTATSVANFQWMMQYKKPEFVRFYRGAICIRWIF